MSKIAVSHGATIDTYVGDAIMGFFGDPASRGSKEDAIACVKMSIAMQRRMRELQLKWLDLGSEKPFQLRIGVNTGFCTVGNFGSEDRMDYTIIGNEVNLAARLQSHADLGGILVHSRNFVPNQGYDPDRGTGGCFREGLRPPGTGLPGRRHL